MARRVNDTEGRKREAQGRLPPASSPERRDSCCEGGRATARYGYFNEAVMMKCQPGSATRPTTRWRPSWVALQVAETQAVPNSDTQQFTTDTCRFVFRKRTATTPSAGIVPW